MIYSNVIKISNSKHIWFKFSNEGSGEPVKNISLGTSDHLLLVYVDEDKR